MRGTAISKLVIASAVMLMTRAQTPTAAQLVQDEGKPAPAFEVATIKPDPSGAGTMNYQIAPGRLRAENATVEQLIRFSYDVRTQAALEKGPKWTSSERFDIDGKIADADYAAIQKLPPEQRFAQYRLMMRELLVDRFGLKISTRMEEQPVYELVVAKSGPKLTPLDAEKIHMPMLWGASKGDLQARSVTMTFFCDWLSGNADAGGRDIVDKTGLTGSYDFALKWTPVESAANAIGGPAAGASAGAEIDEGGPSFFTALEEQLGLKLEASRAPVQVLVIDHVEQPSEN